ncbi:MAG TPA: hypothetical protein VMG12_30575 [Polyangiaceae bacterium]|nr:hypothetical protein [Polyangiaceae bacterium]
MNDPSLSDMARLVAEDFRRHHDAHVDAAGMRELQNAIELALLTAVRNERRACAAECARRAELWERTEVDTTSTTPRVQAQSRANEARYLADLLHARGSLS